MMPSSIRLAVAAGLLVSVTTLAQTSGGTTGSGGTSTGGGSRTGSTSTSTGTPSISNPNNFPNTQTERQILYISGTVVLQAGGPPPEPVAIERVCAGSAHKEGYTDSKGHYQIQLGQNFELQDVSESTSTTSGFGVSGRPGLGSGSMGVNPRDLFGCELRAMLPGFQSSSVMIRPEGSFGEIRMDTIVLQQMGGGTGSTISLTTMQAPGSARKAYEKAEKALQKDNTKDAEKELSKAVQDYPKFAAAWALLGWIHQGNKQFDEATKDYNRSIASDSQYAKPYFGLAYISASQQNWKDTIRFAEQLNRLAPLAYPEAYFFSGVANYNLGKMDEAEKSIRKYLSLDPEHRRPIAVLYLGEILSAKQDFGGAAAQAKAYLALAPNAPNAEKVRERVKQFEQLNTAPAQKQ